MSINKSTIITNIKDFLKEAKNESDMNKSNIIPKANYNNIISPEEIKKESDKKKLITILQVVVNMKMPLIKQLKSLKMKLKKLKKKKKKMKKIIIKMK